MQQQSQYYGYNVTTCTEYNVLSIVDHAVFIEIKGKKRIIHHKNPAYASRSLLEDIPEKQDVEEYNLKEHIDAILASKDDVAEFEM